MPSWIFCNFHCSSGNLSLAFQETLGYNEYPLKGEYFAYWIMMFQSVYKTNYTQLPELNQTIRARIMIYCYLFILYASVAPDFFQFFVHKTIPTCCSCREIINIFKVECKSKSEEKSMKWNVPDWFVLHCLKTFMQAVAPTVKCFSFTAAIIVRSRHYFS